MGIDTRICDGSLFKFHCSHAFQSLLGPFIDPIHRTAVDETGIVPESGPELPSNWRQSDGDMEVADYFLNKMLIPYSLVDFF